MKKQFIKNIQMYSELKKEYSEHASQCKKARKEVEKWGKKEQPNLDFLKQRP